MAQTRRKRQTKHRGNAAGIVEARGRTGRKPTDSEKSGQGRGGQTSRQDRRRARYDKPPTWRGALGRSAIAAVLMFVLASVLTKRLTSALILLPIVFVLYIPTSYYTDLWMYRRNKRKDAAAAAKAAAK